MPLFRSVLFHAPAIYPDAEAMAVELMTYGLVSGLLYGRSRWQCLRALYRSLIIAMLAGRAVWGIAEVILLGLGGSLFTWEAFLAGSLLNAVPGIIIQLLLIPNLMLALNRAGIVQFRLEGQAVTGNLTV